MWGFCHSYLLTCNEKHFRLKMGNKSELEVCLYFFPIDKNMSSIFSSGIFIWQSKNMKKLSPNRARLFVRNKYTVFTMGGTVALRSVNKKISGELQFCSYICIYIYVVTMKIGPFILTRNERTALTFSRGTVTFNVRTCSLMYWSTN